MLSCIKGLDNVEPMPIFRPSLYCGGTKEYAAGALLQNPARKSH